MVVETHRQCRLTYRNRIMRRPHIIVNCLIHGSTGRVGQETETTAGTHGGRLLLPGCALLMVLMSPVASIMQKTVQRSHAVIHPHSPRAGRQAQAGAKRIAHTGSGIQACPKQAQCPHYTGRQQVGRLGSHRATMVILSLAWGVQAHPV